MQEYISKQKLLESVEAMNAEFGNDNSSLVEQGKVLDLIFDFPPEDVVPVVHAHWEVCDYVEYDGHGECVHHHREGLWCSNCKHCWLFAALNEFCVMRYAGVTEDMFLELSKHYEEGAKKYAERNWEKGIPAHCYIDSAVRHLLKFMRGDADEPHDRAFVWNVVGLIWTMKHKPECDDLPKAEKEKTYEA